MVNGQNINKTWHTDLQYFVVFWMDEKTDLNAVYN